MPEIGQTISHYKIIKKIGQGGMGEVFQADDISLNRKVALKFLPREMQQDEAARKRFLREAQSAAALDHPYICNIHEVGEVDGQDFIVMEYVEGQTLKARLEKGALPPRRISPKGGREPVWARDEGELYYLEGDKMMAVEIRTAPEFDAQPLKELFDGNMAVTWWPTYGVAPDGRFLMIREVEQSAVTSPQQIILVDYWFEELKRLCPTGK